MQEKYVMDEISRCSVQILGVPNIQGPKWSSQQVKGILGTSGPDNFATKTISTFCSQPRQDEVKIMRKCAVGSHKSQT